MTRVILHIDMDAFFAAVEQHDHPEWKGKPVIVGSPPDRRGVVSTCSYEARVFGIHSAMPSQRAGQLCPDGIYVRPRMDRYQEVSRRIFEIFHDSAPVVEGLSVDEAFLDITGMERLKGSPKAIAEEIKARILQETGLTCSIGIAPNKFLAKLASEENKPDGLFEVPKDPAALIHWLGQKPIRALWGVGPALAAQLAALGLQTVADLQRVNPETLTAASTPLIARHLLAIAFGRDERPVNPEREDKSYSKEHTYLQDTADREVLQRDLRRLSEIVGRRLREAGVWARTAKIKIRYADFHTVTRQMPFPVPSCDDIALREAARQLLERNLLPNIPVRLIGFGAEHLTASPQTVPEDDLFSQVSTFAHPRAKEERLSHTLDALRKRYGSAILPQG